MEQARQNLARWRGWYWWLVSIPGGVAYAFEAAQVFFFEATRAPRVSLIEQLALLLVFFSLFAAVLRFTWWVIGRSERQASHRLGMLAMRLAALGLVLSGLHLLTLALILRVMYSPDGWGVTHLMHSFAEVWLGQAGLWLLVYGACCATIMWFRNRLRARTPGPLRLQVKAGKRLLSLPVADVLWVESAGNYVELHCRTGSYLLRRPLASLEQAFAHSGLIRSHRRALINIHRVRAIRSVDGHSYIVELDGGVSAPLSRRRLQMFKAAIAQAPASEQTPFITPV